MKKDELLINDPSSIKPFLERVFKKTIKEKKSEIQFIRSQYYLDDKTLPILLFFVKTPHFKEEINFAYDVLSALLLLGMAYTSRKEEVTSGIKKDFEAYLEAIDIQIQER